MRGNKPESAVRKMAPARPAKPPPPPARKGSPGTPASVPKTVSQLKGVKSQKSVKSVRSNASVSIKPPGSPGASPPGSPLIKSPTRPPTVYKKSCSPPPQRPDPFPAGVQTAPTPASLTVTNMDGTILTAHQLQRMVQALKQDLSLAFSYPPNDISIDCIKGSPLTVGFSLTADPAPALAAFDDQRVFLPISCKLYAETTGAPTQHADIDYTSSWVIGKSRAASPAAEIGIGMRVVRNPRYWMWGDQDGGPGGVGTVIDVNTAQGWVAVRWDHDGTADRYRWGEVSGGYDVRVVPTQHYSLPKALVPINQPSPQPLTLNSRVKRNPASWKPEYGDPDGGEGQLGTVIKVQGDVARTGQWVEVRWDHLSAPQRNQAYRWCVNNTSDFILVEDEPAAPPPLPEPHTVTSQVHHDAVRCIQVTVLSARGTPPGVSSRVQISFDGSAPEYTSIWHGDSPSWGETLAIDVPPGVATCLQSKTLRVMHLGTSNGSPSMTPIGGCELEVGHLVGPESQTLWLAMDSSMTSKLRVAPGEPGRSMQTTAASTTSWLRISIGFVFVQLQRAESPLVTHHAGSKLLAHGHNMPSIYHDEAFHMSRRLYEEPPKTHLVTRVNTVGDVFEQRGYQRPPPPVQKLLSNVKFVKARSIRTPVRDLSNDRSFLSDQGLMHNASIMSIPQFAPAPAPVLAPAPPAPAPALAAPALAPPSLAQLLVAPADGDATTVVEYLVQLAFDPVTVLEVAKLLKSERVEDIATLRLLSEDDLKSIGVPLGCRRKIATHLLVR